MKKLSLDEIQGLERYEQARAAIRARIIDLKKHRRVTVGDRVTLVFENRDTMLFQVQEMLRAERIVDIDKVREELEAYNELIPGPNQLSATLFIEITDSADIRAELASLLGIDESVSLRIGAQSTVNAQFEPGRSTDEKLSAVQYVRFDLDAASKDAFVAGTIDVELVVDHPNYRHSVRLAEPVRRSLAADLTAV